MTDLTAEVTSKRNSIRPTAIIALGISLTAAWIGLLGFGLFELIKLAL